MVKNTCIVLLIENITSLYFVKLKINTKQIIRLLTLFFGVSQDE